jgi:hypothetical protein
MTSPSRPALVPPTGGQSRVPSRPRSAARLAVVPSLLMSRWTLVAGGLIGAMTGVNALIERRRTVRACLTAGAKHPSGVTSVGYCHSVINSRWAVTRSTPWRCLDRNAAAWQRSSRDCAAAALKGKAGETVGRHSQARNRSWSGPRVARDLCGICRIFGPSALGVPAACTRRASCSGRGRCSPVCPCTCESRLLREAPRASWWETGAVPARGCVVPIQREGAAAVAS